MRYIISIFKSEKKLLFTAFSIFIVSWALGIVLSLVFEDQIIKLFNTLIKKFFQNLLKNVSTSSDLFFVILKNNLRVYLVILTLGTISFGLVSAFVLFTNGLIVGIVSTIYAKQTSILKTLLLILPHGIFEISAFVIGSVASAIFLKESISKKQPNLKEASKKFITFSTAGALLVVFAAFIEAFITPIFAK
ncbi:stage II sporulation protein M [Anaerocellum diazotrophicum]|uniref:Membrane protein n=1 Tax=Caldicellulosiruptor diazotrophicus TaxID=2806205 RepID=A0ABM7NIZ7_9FIRM|nr:stage II sporulation protein M [Caldicellulosiruptor diazotrophicus]BCS80067.1 membrane protein [Caldicellulosiruptor diazotrophicus]